ncbi:sodium channel protein Nach-like [Frankliniella occidentalis]|uniref:Sodium channel protein Nach-like n=1 Tax=Frankliniella occidentalis TaxID=133901 RepID=A0A9C6X9D5_FRAOC|nr:sodium channel protein Nach-like [Frankliniella occidentalis]
MDVPCQTALFSPESGQPLSIARCHLCGTLCEHVKYIVKSSAGALNWSTDPGNFFVSSRHPGRRNASEYAVVHVYARRSIVTRNKMDLHLQREDLLGALGGLSGLFVGFSLVAGFECLYFFTIRPCFRDGHGHTMMAGKRDGVAHEKQSSKTEDALITVPGIGRISPLITAPPRIFTLSKPHRRGRRHGVLAH